MKVKANAKLNLCLNVFDKQGNFHEIDSVAVSVDICDYVTVTEREDCEFTLCGMDYDEKNTALRSAKAFATEFNTKGVDIVVTKQIPFASGLGGSSADAGAVVWAMCELFGVEKSDERVKNVCNGIGSDVYFMMTGGLGRMRGFGGRVDFCQCQRKLHFVVATFEKGMLTSDVYRAFDSVEKCSATDVEKVLESAKCGNVDGVIAYQNNMLFPAVCSLSDYAERFLCYCKENGLPFNMTGSGSAFYCLCKDFCTAQSVCRKLNESGFNCTVCSSVEKGVEIVSK